MTLPSEKIGDNKNLRYEVTYFDPRTKDRKVLGWAGDMMGARALASSITSHPVWKVPLIRDRQWKK